MGSSKAPVNDDSANESARCTALKDDPDSDPETETDDELLPSLESCPFTEGERVLAHHSSQIYEAKVLKAECRLKEWKYFVHYVGWNKNWDEWIGLDRVMKYNKENIARQQALNKKNGNENNAMAWRVSQLKPRCPNVARGRKRKKETSDSEKDATSSEKLVILHIPPTLRKQLINDCEFITQLGKLVKLPRRPNVEEISKKYLEYRTKKHGMVTESVHEILKGLRCYFDKALPVMLLYKSEREQYEEMISGDVSPSTVYGAEHLLRLFVKLPELLFHANIADDTLKELQENLIDILKFLKKNQTLFFLHTYHGAENSGPTMNK